MGYWNYINVGASAEPENIEYVEKIFEYIGYAEEPGYSDGDECSFDDPDVYCCKYSAYEPYSGKIKKCFAEYDETDLLYILNALFPKTDVYIHSAEGNNTDDTWQNHDIVYDTEDMTCYYEDSYTSHDCGPNGSKSSKARFVLKPPKQEYVSALIDLSQIDNNDELVSLLTDLLEKLKQGKII